MSEDLVLPINSYPTPYFKGELWRWMTNVILILLALLLFGGICWLKVQNILFFWYAPVFQIYSLAASGFVLSRVILCMFYREPPDRNYTPTVTVVVPYKNEGAHIADTIDHIYASEYPTDKIEVIAIDDGSTDESWSVVESQRSRYPTLRSFQFPKNRGKRDAMALGAQEASGEILVYIDSDSNVAPDGIYKLVQPFVDPGIGAVAGHILVIVEPKNIISKMESVRYYIAHRIVKAVESIFGAVTCCSGAFSAYRRSVVLPVLPQWLNQMFLGTRATFGDDRSLTNFVLKTHRVIFHFGAHCSTYVPNRWPQFFRQQLRWKKSWTRETLVASRILWKKHPIAAISYYQSVLLTLMSPFIVLRAVILHPLLSGGHPGTYMLGLCLVYFFLCVVYYYFTRSRYWFYGMAFAWLYVGALCWMNYYAMVTVTRTQWGTR